MPKLGFTAGVIIGCFLVTTANAIFGAALDEAASKPNVAKSEYYARRADILAQVRTDAILDYAPAQQLDILIMMSAAADSVILDAELKGCTGIDNPLISSVEQIQKQLTGD